MKLNYKLHILFIGFLFAFQKTSAQNVSNEGLEFWACFPDHVPSEEKIATMSLFITSKNNSSGVVSCDSYSEPFTVKANTVTEILVPRTASFIGSGSGISKNKGIRVKVNEGQAKVVVYAHVFAGFRSAATLVLPYEALGSKHFAMAYDQKPALDNNYHSQIDVVAVEPNTTINIRPVINGVPQAAFSQTLVNIGDVYQFQNIQDVTGTLIEVDSLTSGCKRIAVFSGSSGIGISTPTCDIFDLKQPSLDPLLQQLYPIESWGKTFPLVPFYNRNAGSIYRVIASEDNTNVTVNGVKTILNAGTFYSSPPITSISLIQADKPISVAQFAISQFCSDSRNEFADVIVGDPDMVILNPLEYSIDRITLYSSSKLAITEQYINVVIPTNKVSTFTLNKVNFTNNFSPIPNSTSYSYAQINLTGLGTNFNLAADTGFNAMAYGFGQTESYAYSAGTSLAATTIVNAVKYGTNDVVEIACVNQPYDFKLYLPYIPTKLTWQLGTSTATITQNAPAAEQVVINNKLLYQFKLPANKAFTTSGTKNITVVSSIPVGASVCSTVDEEKINYTFEVSDLPVAEFTAPAKVCITKAVKFAYIEKNVGEPVISWLWDFGDGTTSTEQSPSHLYTKLKAYKVKLSLTSKAGCISDIFEKSIEIIKPLNNKFEIVSPLCTNTSISFVDQTVSTDGIIEWLWDFGDGTTANEQNPFHTYSKSGTYQLRLSTKSQTGCTETLEKTIKVTDPAEIDFTDPGSCINDLVAFNAIIKGGTVSSWLWDFGDGSIDINERVKQNPQHKYISTGVYNVSLKATTLQGCVTTLIKTITISDSNPKVSFEVLDKNSLCSNTAVNFKNTSTIVFGNIVKLEIIYENKAGGASVIFTDDTPTFGEIYTYKYPKSSVDQNYQVVFRTYSGQLCYQESEPLTLTVSGSPELKFDNVEPVCLNSPKFLLSAAKETTGIKGAFKLEGKGIVGNYFDPAFAGTGEHLITYTFIATNGCQEIITNLIKVVDIPKIDTGKDLDILLAGEKRIDAKVIGENVTYKWTPAIGLSDDSILDPIASPSESTKYTLLVTSKDGCMAADEVYVTVHVDPMIPNVFSPNADGINDTWSVKYLETFVRATIRIFNRAGQQVFFSNQYTTPWDGKYNNVEVPVGVYYYIIEPNNGRNRYTGSITLLR